MDTEPPPALFRAGAGGTTSDFKERKMPLISKNPAMITHEVAKVCLADEARADKAVDSSATSVTAWHEAGTEFRARIIEQAAITMTQNKLCNPEIVDIKF